MSSNTADHARLRDVEPVQRLGYLWTSPSVTTDEKGLGGGIKWAFDPTLCENLIPAFSERPVFGVTLLSCHQIQASIHRGFNAWSDNSAKLRFIDVTEECKRLGITDATCPLAEVFVTWLKPTELDEMRGAGEAASRSRSLLELRGGYAGRAPFNETAAAGGGLLPGARRSLSAPQLELPLAPTSQEMSAGGETAALARSYPAYTQDFRSSNGFEPPGLVVEATRASIAFNPTLCWYLDSEFCSFFHYLKVYYAPMSQEQIIWIVRAVLAAIWIFALLRFCQHFVAVTKRVLEERSERVTLENMTSHALAGDPMGLVKEVGQQAANIHFNIRSKADAALDAIAHQRATGWLSRGVLLVAPITFYTSIFVPCWSCFDFEAAAAHEIGHVLGLSHPDEIPPTAPGRPGAKGGVNTVLDVNMTAGKFDCTSPWTRAVPGANGSDTRPSIMRTLTQHNPSVCLAYDDLEALNVLYPDCSDSVITEPVCYYPSKNIGLVRFFAITFVPICIAAAVVILINEAVRQRQKKRHKDVEDMMRDHHDQKDEEVKNMVKHILKEQHRAERRKFGSLRRSASKRGKSNAVGPEDSSHAHDDDDHDDHPRGMLGRMGSSVNDAHLEAAIADLRTTRAHDAPRPASSQPAACGGGGVMVEMRPPPPMPPQAPPYAGARPPPYGAGAPSGQFGPPGWPNGGQGQMQQQSPYARQQPLPPIAYQR